MIEKKWQSTWVKNQIYKTEVDSSKPKYYVLDMFPYPSGAGLHVGHPLGYIASDIISRYKRLQGFNVLHPMGYDAFGLPAEQYAIQTGQHPAITTETNIKRYREQLDQMGFSFDWSREVQTCDPHYYKWTQWAFIQMYEHWYDQKNQKSRPISELIEHFDHQGNLDTHACHHYEQEFSSADWARYDAKTKDEILHHYRIAYRTYMKVNWCEKLGTVLANDEIKDGFSVRGGHPVVQKAMQQWCLRVSAFAPRLLDGLKSLDWPGSLQEIQKHWIGRSQGALLNFQIADHDAQISVFTTRPDTIFGATFIVLAPEHELVAKITRPEHRESIRNYVEKSLSKTERERMKDGGTASGAFTGAYCIHPLSGEKIPIWISDYVLAGYGTGAIMAVPAHDDRDYLFAKTFDIPILEVVSGGDTSKEAFVSHAGTLVNSDFLDGLQVADAINRAIEEVEKRGLGTKRVQFRLRDAIFSRQRYWGEPIPMSYNDEGIAQPLSLEDLPLVLPKVDSYQPTSTGEPPLARAADWIAPSGQPLELTTMPGFAGSSAYYLRYMDPHNENELVGKTSNAYWNQVDLYVGGAEHATGHLIYSRFWNMFLFDLGIVANEEPFKKIINQGMIQGVSALIYRIKGTNTFVSSALKSQHPTSPIHIDVSLVDDQNQVDLAGLRQWRPEFKEAEFQTENDLFICDRTVEKMSKSLYNVVNPDSIVEKYGADTLRMYEMFLGPIDQAKPWNTNGIEGVSRFLNKLYRLFYSADGEFLVVDTPAKDEDLKALHPMLQKIESDLESYSFNTCVSAFMIAVNQLSKSKCHSKSILEPLVQALSPFAPHLAEELWAALGHEKSVQFSTFPKFDSKYTSVDNISYPVSINGKKKFILELPMGLSKADIENQLDKDARFKKLTDGKTIKKKIIVPGKIINLVV